MKRMHIHVGVDSIDQSIKFYTALFGTAPIKSKVDYAKWELTDPLVNFAISTRAQRKGVDHLGIQVEDRNELEEIHSRLKVAQIPLFDEGEVACCYSRSEKSWLEDPAGIGWETYQNMEDVQYYSSTKKFEADEETCCPTESETVTESCCS